MRGHRQPKPTKTGFGPGVPDGPSRPHGATFEYLIINVAVILGELHKYINCQCNHALHVKRLFICSTIQKPTRQRQSLHLAPLAKHRQSDCNGKNECRAAPLAVAIAAFNQLSGINAVLFYAPRIFEAAGLEASSALLQSVGIGLANLPRAPTDETMRPRV